MRHLNYKKVFAFLPILLLLFMLPVQAAQATRIPGDVNGDGEVNISDVTDIIDGILKGIYDEVMDVDGDGEVNISDLTALIDLILNPEINITLTLSQEDAVMGVGEQLMLTATVQPASQSGNEIIWSSSNLEVATVTDGMVTAVGQGECDIVAQYGDVSAVCHIQVQIILPEEVSLNRDSVNLEPGITMMLTATVLPENTTDKTITWSTTDEAVAQISVSGNKCEVSAITEGECDVVADCQGKQAVCHIKVEIIYPDSISLNRDSASLELGQSLMLTATLSPEHVTDGTITWTTTDESVARISVSGNLCEVFTMSVGECDVIADCQGKQAVCHIEVYYIYPDTVTLNKTSANLDLGKTMMLTATVYPDNASDKTVNWSITDSTVLKIASSANKCVVTALASGECDVIADCHGKKGICHVKVRGNDIPESVTLSKENSYLELGKTLLLEATVSPENLIDKTITWSTTNPMVARISPADNKCTVAGIGLGECDVIADCHGVQARCHISVVEARLKVMTLNMDFATMMVSDTLRLIPRLTPSISIDGVLWSSSNESVVTVEKGLLTAVSDGYCEITATCQDKQASCYVAVYKTVNVNGVSFNMLPVQGGTFMMGSSLYQTGSNVNEKPQHQVTISDYMICDTEVTQELWKAVMGAIPPGYFKGHPKFPVENITWEDCQLFIAQLNSMTGLNFHLPTEAQWEYAARGGVRSKGYVYAGSTDIEEVGWYYNNSGALGVDDPDYGPHDVASKKPNELNLYDMTGNVREWCQDWYTSYTADPQVDPTGPETGSYKVYRDGSWHDFILSCRITFRYPEPIDFKREFLGMRLAL